MLYALATQYIDDGHRHDLISLALGAKDVMTGGHRREKGVINAQGS
jgi:hypothetical protein